MRSTLLLIFALAFATPALAKMRQTHGPPPVQPTPPVKPAAASNCFELRMAKAPDQKLRWARLQVGDKWITGCLGNEGECLVPIWVPC